MKTKRQALKAGYSMVEITLALLVAGVGIMGAFALFPEGLKAGREAVDVTECSAFVNSVFANLEFQSASEDVLWETEIGEEYPVYELTHSLQIAGQPSIHSTTGDIYYWIPNYYFGDITYAAAVFTYRLEISNYNDNVKYARLEVWPGNVGEFVSTPGYPPGKVFYREFTPVK